MEALITKAKKVYAAAGLNCADGLMPPSGKEAIDRIASALSLPIPEELRALYSVHGGQEYIHPGTTGLFGAHRLYSPEEVIESHGIYTEYYLPSLDPPPTFPPEDDEDPGFWVPELIPFASWDAYDLCIHAYTEEVWESLPSTGLIRHRPSIASVLEEVIASVAAGNEAELGTLR